MHYLGPIVRLQVQRADLKVGERGVRRYEPAAIAAVPSLIIGPGGVVTCNEHGMLLDVHHRDHPAGKNRIGVHGLSLLFTAHYQAMRERFGPHVTDGIAGESILIETGRQVTPADVSGGVVVESGDHRGRITITKITEPCVEFTRYCLQRPPEERADDVLTDALRFLRDGLRGFYARYDGDPLTLRLGDRVYLP